MRPAAIRCVASGAPGADVVPPSITRRSFSLALLGTPGALGAAARGGGLGQMQWDYQLDYLRLLEERRVTNFEAITAQSDIIALRQNVREKLAEMWGPVPAERSPLNARVVGTIERDDYVIEKIIFESRPKFYVTANLYRPKVVQGKLPAVVVSCGHTDDGKAAETYQRFCILLARHGFIALISDPVGQGERLQLWSEAKKASLTGPGTKEHRALGNQCYLLGLNLMGYRVWDASRAIDYLLERPDVNPERIAMGGNSGGGMETLQYATYDSRIQGAFVGCAVASFKAKTESLLIADPEQILHRTLRHGIDHPELLASFAPRPLLIGSAIRDFVPIDAARYAFKQVSRVYGLVNAEHLAKLVETDDTHGLNEDLRVAAVDWFSRWLSDMSREVREAPATISTEEELRCTKTGQVASSLASKTVVDFNQERAARIRPTREPPRDSTQYGFYKSEIQAKVKEITRVGSYKPERGIFIPDRILESGAYAKGVAIVVSDQDKDSPALRRAVIDPIIASNYNVIALDLRGWGETRTNLEGVRVSFDWDDFFAYRGLEIGRPLLGQRLKDLMAVSASRARRQRWTLVGVGAGALVAAHAAVLSPRVESLLTVGGLLSYRSVLDDPLATQPFSSYLPGVIGAYDVRDLYAAAAPRRVLALNPRDARLSEVDEVKAWEEYDWVSQAYETAGSAGRFEMKASLDLNGMRSAIGDWFRS